MEKCNICTKPVNTGYKRIIKGRIVEMCCNKVHKPYLTTGATRTFFNKYWNSQKQS
jgi:hypothetical protein